MNRLQKKCLIVSASCHGLLLLILLVGPAFFTSRDTANSAQLLNMISGKVVDDAMSSGGRPNTESAPPVQQPQASPQPPPAASAEPIKAVEPVRAPTPPQIKPVDHVKPSPPKPDDFTIVKAKKIEPVKDTSDDFQPVTHAPTKPPQAKPSLTPNKNLTDSKSAQPVDNSKQIAAALGKINGLKSGLASGAKIEFNGTSGDSDALVSNYSDIVKSKYAGAWSAPFGTLRDPGPVTVRVTIARDGRVTDHQIISRSSDAAMDKSIQNTLDNVTFIEPFPASSKDLERTFTIEFNLADKQTL